MSRSYKHKPIRGFTTCDSEKKEKRKANRALRRANHVVLQKNGEYASFVEMNQVQNPWDMGKDGRRRFNPKEEPKLMRK